MSSVTALLPLEQAEASSSLRVSLLQYLHLVIKPPSPHLIKIYSLEPAYKMSFVPMSFVPLKQLHHTGGIEETISQFFALKQRSFRGRCFNFKALICWGGVARSQLWVLNAWVTPWGIEGNGTEGQLMLTQGWNWGGGAACLPWASLGSSIQLGTTVLVSKYLDPCSHSTSSSTLGGIVCFYLSL